LARRLLELNGRVLVAVLIALCGGVMWMKIDASEGGVGVKRTIASRGAQFAGFNGMRNLVSGRTASW